MQKCICVKTVTHTKTQCVSHEFSYSLNNYRVIKNSCMNLNQTSTQC